MRSWCSTLTCERVDRPIGSIGSVVPLCAMLVYYNLEEFALSFPEMVHRWRRYGGPVSPQCHTTNGRIQGPQRNSFARECGEFGTIAAAAGTQRPRTDAEQGQHAADRATDSIARLHVCAGRGECGAVLLNRPPDVWHLQVRVCGSSNDEGGGMGYYCKQRRNAHSLARAHARRGTLSRSVATFWRCATASRRKTAASSPEWWTSFPSSARCSWDSR